jgi:hypothetical protein
MNHGSALKDQTKVVRFLNRLLNQTLSTIMQQALVPQYAEFQIATCILEVK